MDLLVRSVYVIASTEAKVDIYCILFFDNAFSSRSLVQFRVKTLIMTLN